MKFIREHLLFLIILLSCAILRFIPLFEYQFTLDELSGLIRTQYNSFGELIEKGVKIDAHPALIQVFIYYLSKLFGYTTWVIKLPFLLFSLGTIVYAYAFALRNFSKQVALFSSLVFSFSLVFVFYASIARMYISGIFFSMALLFYFYEIFFLKNTKTVNFVMLGLFALLSALNQHINGLFALTLCLSGLFFLSKLNYKKYLLTCLITIVVYLPHLPVTLYQLNIGGIGLDEGGWLEKPEFSVIFKFQQILFGTGITGMLFVTLIIFKNVFDAPTKMNFKHLFLLFIFFLNFLVVYFYSVQVTSIYQHSAMLFAGVGMVFVGCAFFDFSKKYFFYPALAAVAFFLVYTTYFKKEVLGQTVKTVFEYQFERTDHYKKLLGDKNVYPIFMDADDFMRKIYFEKYKTQFECQLSSDTVTKTIKEFSNYVAALKKDYLVLTSATPLHSAIAQQYFPYLLENTQTQANNFKLFSKIRPKDLKAEADKVLLVSSPTDTNHFTYSPEALNNYLKNDSNLKVDSNNEFPFDAKIEYNTLFQKEGQVTLLKARCKAEKPASSKIETCASVSNAQSTLLYNAKSAGDYVLRKDSSIIIYVDLLAGSKHERIRRDSAMVTFYLWNKSRENFKLKEFEIQVIDYWPQKWGFWK